MFNYIIINNYFYDTYIANGIVTKFKIRIKEIDTILPIVNYNNWTAKILMNTNEFKKLVNLVENMKSNIEISCCQNKVKFSVNSYYRQLSITYNQNLNSNNKIIQVLCKSKIKKKFEIEYLLMIQNIKLINKYITIPMHEMLPFCIACEIDTDSFFNMYFPWSDD